MRKKCKESEANNYALINSKPEDCPHDFPTELRKLKPITPKFYKVDYNAEQKRWDLTIENMCAFHSGKCPAVSFLDLKLGTTTLTKRHRQKSKEYQEIKCKHLACTTHEQLGFCVVGFLIKDKNGHKVESGYKIHDKITWD